MGVVNVTPDSFSDGGEALRADAAVARGRALIDDGADIIDVGGESTRPGAEPVPVELELARVVPVVRALAAQGVLVSVDTRRAEVMDAALDAGARTTGTTRASSSSTGTGSAPGRVDSPPTSMMSAPSSINARARATAASARSASPPSEKLSGVTLTTPISRGLSRPRPANVNGPTGSEIVRACATSRVDA